MANWYYDKNCNKVGPISTARLMELAAQGIIEPETRIENSKGQSTLARQIPRLNFDTATPPPTAQTPPAQPVPVPPPPPQPSPKELFCTNCGNSISEQAVACMSCGAKPTGYKKFCRQCGVPLNPEQIVCVKCGTGVKSSFGAGVESVVGTLSSMGKAFSADTAAHTNTSQPLNIYFTVGILAGFLFFVTGLVRVFSLELTVEEGLMAWKDESDAVVYFRRIVTDAFLIFGFVILFVGIVGIVLRRQAVPSIFKAARKGTLNEVRYFLDKGVNVNVTNWAGWTPLHYAAGSNNLETVQFLVSKGADINAKDRVGGWTPLDLAKWDGNKKIVDYLSSLK